MFVYQLNYNYLLTQKEFMRKLIKTRLCNLLIAGFIIFIASCEDNMENSDAIDIVDKENSCERNNEMIIDAQNFFETKVQNSFSSSSQKNGNHGNVRKSLRKFLLWDEAYIKQLSFGVGIVIPLSYEMELYVPKGDSRLPLSQLSYVLIYKNEKGKWKAELVTTLPDETFSNSTDENQPFSGGVIVENWNGKFIKGFLYKGGQATIFTPKDDNSKVFSGECWTTEYMDCVSFDDGNTWFCTTYAEETWCGSGGGGGSSGGGEDDYPPGGGGSSGESGGTDTGTDDLDTPQDLNQTEIDSLNAAMNELIQAYCANQQVINNAWGDITFQMNNSMGSNALYNPSSNTITFRNILSINNATVLQEVFHSFQNMFYQGGIGQYENSAGELNIEFEAWVYTEVWLYIEGEQLKFEKYLFFNQKYEWNDWILEIADNGFSTTALDDYEYWMNIFGEKLPDYNNPLDGELINPDAAMSIFDLCNY